MPSNTTPTNIISQYFLKNLYDIAENIAISSCKSNKKRRVSKNVSGNEFNGNMLLEELNWERSPSTIKTKAVVLLMAVHCEVNYQYESNSRYVKSRYEGHLLCIDLLSKFSNIPVVVRHHPDLESYGQTEKYLTNRLFEGADKKRFIHTYTDRPFPRSN